MALNDTSTGSPGWWLLRLLDQLTKKRPRYELLHRYGTGDHRLPEGDERCREVFRQFQRKARANYTGLVKQSLQERLHVVGFRAGGESTDEADRTAWRIWRGNHLDADAKINHDAALTFSNGYVIVGPGDGDMPLITVEDPREVIAEADPVNRRRLRAAVKTWVDDAAEQRLAVVYLPESVHYFVSPLTQRGGNWPGAQWSPDPDTPDAANSLGEVPVVRFVNRPQLDGSGLAEFEDVIDIQDRINNAVLDRLVITKMQAYRQRWAKGISTEDEHGNPLDLPFVPGVDLLWAVEDENAEFGDFTEADIRQVLAAVRDDVQDLSAVSRTPPHYLLGQMTNISGEALTAAEAGLVSKSRDRMGTFGESWAQVMTLALRYQGAAVPADMETLWADPQQRSEQELADASVKKAQAGVPWRQRMRDLGYTPPQVDRMESERTQDALMAGLAADMQATTSQRRESAASADGSGP